jgi:hypothetical protein
MIKLFRICSVATLSITAALINPPSYAGGVVHTGYAKGARIICHRGGCVERQWGNNPGRSQAFRSMRLACTVDARKLCGHVIWDTFARAACMRQHVGQLSLSCQKARLNAGI